MQDASQWPETRYGMPAADQILINRHYIVGYSYYYRQAKWALEIVDRGLEDVERSENFRSDFRIPELFRVDKAQYEGSGFDRGHLVASANQNEEALQDSETFLLSNMSPQTRGFNRGVWKRLETAVRKLNELDDVYEVYVISGPIFDFDLVIETITTTDSSPIKLPVPHLYFKSVLAERKSGALHMWSFVMPHASSSKSLEKFLVPTRHVEVMVGVNLWDQLTGSKISEEKDSTRTMWEH
ncbi:MAG: DNA/RNA endonuclease G [Gammaproteobacteria bacterium]|nr:MAG: DNA/RNA endonuclease G [Gammaproteobacteria bacterium]